MIRAQGGNSLPHKNQPHLTITKHLRFQGDTRWVEHQFDVRISKIVTTLTQNAKTQIPHHN